MRLGTPSRRRALKLLAGGAALYGAASAQFPSVGDIRRKAEREAKKAAVKEVAKALFPLEEYGAHVRATNPFIDWLAPARFSDMRTLARTATGGYRLAPGAWRVEDGEGYCLKPGSYARPGGAGYLSGELTGKLAPYIRTILGGAYGRPDLDRRDIQRLIWGMIAGRDIADMHPDARAVAAALLSPAQIASYSAEGFAPPELTAAARRALPRPAREAYDATLRLRRIAGEPGATYEDMERVAVASGEAPPTDNDIPPERWSWNPAGYFVRYFSTAYQRLTTEIVVAEPATVTRDALGRIVNWAFTNGDSVSAAYLDEGPLRSPVYPQADGWRFASLVIRAFNSRTGGFETARVDNRGFCFLERRDGRRGEAAALRYASLGLADFAFLQSGGSIPVIDVTDLIEQAQAARERQEFYEERIRRATEPPSREDVDNMLDLDHYADGVEAAFGGPSDRAEWLIDHFERQQRTLAYATNVIASLGEPSGDEAVHEPSTESALPANGGYQQIRAGTGR